MAGFNDDFVHDVVYCLTLTDADRERAKPMLSEKDSARISRYRYRHPKCIIKYHVDDALVSGNETTDDELVEMAKNWMHVCTFAQTEFRVFVKQYLCQTPVIKTHAEPVKAKIMGFTTAHPEFMRLVLDCPWLKAISVESRWAFMQKCVLQE